MYRLYAVLSRFIQQTWESSDLSIRDVLEAISCRYWGLIIKKINSELHFLVWLLGFIRPNHNNHASHYRCLQYSSALSVTRVLLIHYTFTETQETEVLVLRHKWKTPEDRNQETGLDRKPDLNQVTSLRAHTLPRCVPQFTKTYRTLQASNKILPKSFDKLPGDSYMSNVQ